MMKFILPIQPLPKPRMNARSVWFKKEYWEYFNALKECIWENAVYPFDEEPPIITDDVRLKIKAFRKGEKRADWDNLGKAVSDAIEKSGLIKNDRQIVDAEVKVFYNQKNPRIEFTIEVIKGRGIIYNNQEK